MTNNIKYVKTLTVSDLFDDENKCNYIIPIYQRNYAWGDNEISSLLQDIKNACEKNKEQDKNYYIGSLVVYRRENDDFEVIDGQQRLTTLTLIMHHLGKLGFRNVFFEHRDESQQALSNLNSGKLPSNFLQALKTIKKVIDEWGNNKDEIVEFLLDKVEIIRTEVPEGTDLNHYFEIMNTRGEQLEKHEVLKARLMKKLSGDIEKSLFAKIWDACSDMSRYAVMGFDSKIRGVIFSDKWSEKPKCFMEIIQDIEEYNKEIEKKNKDENKKSPIINIQVDVDGIKILDLINGSENSGVYKNDFVDKYDGSFTPVIDFPNFLMHVLRIYLEMTDKCGDFTKIASLDEKYLLNSFEGQIKDDEAVRNFIYVLLICRYLFDCYVIKSNTIRTGEENWSLWAVMPNDSSYYYKNTFDNNTESKNDEELDNSDDTKTVVMLLSMFHVSNPSRIYKNWLYAVLRWLFNNKDNITPDNYIHFLEELCDKFYFGNNCQGKDITEIILDEVEFELNSRHKENWDRGVNVPNFVFNRLDYQLWRFPQSVEILSKNDDWLTDNTKDAIWKKFRFTFRSSVEHHYPQHPIDGHTIKEIDMFGNLYLLSQSKNSRLSNLTPVAKRDIIKTWKNCDSLKQVIMMSHDKWGEDEIKEHGEEMLEILNQPLSKANS
ncbi:DUF262 domain-containing HNH endonuclease family protein [Haemophilus influenzae]|uniref:GmrSD restriction endonuclease domain-containing protein n=1 Tax=Haemophilus influenzae TaxID=727 RepID=UPI0005AF000A|nr:DUF262 domain-containing protein [Haemophilus influenzae]AXP61802.1 DUF262 domain-containing protein [Haemophilus influenzae]KIP51129.1 hypothetical protein SU58_00490 [Haemophilus influenzae]MCK9682252.1 DUF262 domain-containing HNH endonuclease family protein [Haemophilus influenzae]RFN98084.1 DUF262 domain-containing protein [Haemophilus influenzae]